MKKIILLMALCIAFCNVEAQKVVFLKTGGTGDGSTPATPMSSLNSAYLEIENAGSEGIIVIVDKFTVNSAFARANASPFNITITSKYNDIDYRDGNPNCILEVTAGLRWTLFRPTTFENISIQGVATPSQSYLMFVANYHPIIMGEGIVVTGFPTAAIASSISIIGGSQSGQNGQPPSGTTDGSFEDVDSHITIKSGKYIVVGFNRGIAKTCTGTAYIDISGGEVFNLYCGSIDADKGGSVDLNISGGKFTGSIYVNSGTTNRASGKGKVSISGGDFSAPFSLIYGSMDLGAKISVYADPDLLPAFWSKISLTSPFDQKEMIIPANVTATADMYDSGSDIVFLSDETSTGQLTAASPLTLTGDVKLKKTFETETWYPVGFPFEIAGYWADFSTNPDLSITDGDFELKAYDGVSDLFSSADAMTTNEGYVAKFPENFEDMEVVFTSAADPVLANIIESDLEEVSGLSGKADGYYMIANPSANNLTLTTPDKYYVFDGDTHFVLMTSGVEVIKPFESFVITKNVPSASLRPKLNIEGKTPTALEKQPAGEKVIATKYYNLQGIEITQPQKNNIYLVKKIYDSGKSEFCKQYK